jgi:hypothetical protein
VRDTFKASRAFMPDPCLHRHVASIPECSLMHRDEIGIPDLDRSENGKVCGDAEGDTKGAELHSDCIAEATGVPEGVSRSADVGETVPQRPQRRGAARSDGSRLSQDGCADGAVVPPAAGREVCEGMGEKAVDGGGNAERGGSQADVSAAEQEGAVSSSWEEAGWLNVNPLGVPTEREVHAAEQGRQLWRMMLLRH